MPDQGLSFVQFSDTHIAADPSWKPPFATQTADVAARAVVRAIESLPFKPAFVIHTGDITRDSNKNAYRLAAQIFESLTPPCHVLPGNHDDAEMMQEFFPRFETPKVPFTFTFEENGTRLIGLDSTAASSDQRGHLGPDQLAWLEGALDADSKPALVFVHHNLLPIGIRWLDDYMGTLDGEAAHRILAKRRDRVKGVFFGHVHQNIQMMADGILYCSAPSAWAQFLSFPGQTRTSFDEGAEPGFNVIMLKKGRLFVRHHRFEVEDRDPE